MIFGFQFFNTELPTEQSTHSAMYCWETEEQNTLNDRRIREITFWFSLWFVHVDDVLLIGWMWLWCTGPLWLGREKYVKWQQQIVKRDFDNEIKGLKNISTWTMSCWFTPCFCKIIFIRKEDYGALWLGVQYKWRNKTLTIKHCQRHNGTMLSQEDPNTLF